MKLRVTSHKEQNAKISRQSSLLKLDPFIDEEGLIRVGGRLENSTLPFEVKHPIVLQRSSQVIDQEGQALGKRNDHERNSFQWTMDTGS